MTSDVNLSTRFFFVVLKLPLTKDLILVTLDALFLLEKKCGREEEDKEAEFDVAIIGSNDAQRRTETYLGCFMVEQCR
jgi:hypothetical protein